MDCSDFFWVGGAYYGSVCVPFYGFFGEYFVLGAGFACFGVDYVLSVSFFGGFVAHVDEENHAFPGLFCQVEDWFHAVFPSDEGACCDGVESCVEVVFGYGFVCMSHIIDFAVHYGGEF